MVNLKTITEFQKKHSFSDIMGVIRTIYPNVVITLPKNSEKQNEVV